ncbi:MAG: DNA mismatch repair protein MutS, partial [Pelosinus sp.]|nr:DNA mismatch repair protein MutS [Pelosinus sp.]
MSVTYTPMLEQYREIKSKHVHEILFFRLGDFYEMFFEDAELASRELEITLTSREAGQNQRIPMCGIPYHAAENYIARLIAKGYKVAICEQVEDPKLVKGLVKREVIKIITPGTVLTEALLPDAANNYLAALYEEEDVLYLAAADISTGECMWALFKGASRLSALLDHLFHLMPAELILASSIKNLADLTGFIESRIPHCSTTNVMLDDSASINNLPKQHFSKEELPDSGGALLAVASLLYYLHQTVKTDLSHINHLVKYNSSDYLILDAATLRNLEITRNMRDGSKRDTLLSVLDFTKTAMGGRLLKKWLEYPLINQSQIIRRQEAVAELIEKPAARAAISECMASIYDFERILTRLEVGTANARDLVALRSSLEALPEIKAQLKDMSASLFSHAGMSIMTHSDVSSLIGSAIVDNPPLSVREGGMIKAGYDLELDELRSISHDSKQWIQNLETTEREKT